MEPVTTDAPRYVPYRPPPPPPPPNARRRRVVLVVVLGWVAVLVGTGAWYAFHGRPTVREQTTIGQAQATVDRAVGLVVGGAGATAVPAITGYQESATCRITPARSGAKYQRVAWLYTQPGNEPALLRQVTAALPAGYRAHYQPSADGTTGTLRADAGDYVAVTGTVAQPGAVKVVADTGCRPVGKVPAADPTTEPAGAQPVHAMLAALGVTAADWSTHTLPCGLRTVEAVSAPGQTVGSLPAPAGPAVVHRDDLYADTTGLAVRTAGGRATVTLTSGAGGCGQ
jgi:hypothetical protein